MQVLTQELGPPTTVRTPLVINAATFELFAPHLESPTDDDVREPFESLNILPGVAWIEPGGRLGCRALGPKPWRACTQTVSTVQALTPGAP
jgi:hypothetical protein